MKIEVIYSQWAGGGQIFSGGVHEIAKPSAELLKHLAAAEDAGSVRLLEGKSKLPKHVQSQADGEKAYEKAQRDGSWQAGNIAQFDLDVMSGTRSDL